jgi:oxalate decarboxylase
MSDAQSSPPGPLPQPERGDAGGTIAGPRNLPRELENPDLLVPPSTDSGTLDNLRFSFADAHMRLRRAAGRAR